MKSILKICIWKYLHHYVIYLFIGSKKPNWANSNLFLKTQMRRYSTVRQLWSSYQLGSPASTVSCLLYTRHWSKHFARIFLFNVPLDLMGMYCYYPQCINVGEGTRPRASRQLSKYNPSGLLEKKKERKVPPFPSVRQLGSNMAPFLLSGLTAHPG